MAEEFHDDWEVVPYDLNKKPKEDPDTHALVPANTERQLEAMPLRRRSSTQSYHAQPVLTAPPQTLLLKGPSAKKEATIKVPAGTRILPPRPNEKVVGVKTNRSGEISIIRHTTEEERPYFEGIRAAVDTIFGHVSLDTHLEVMGCKSAGGEIMTNLQENYR